MAGSPNTDVTEYEWDDCNRLVKVTHRDVEDGPATKVLEYTYDYLGRRIRKTVDSDGDGTPEEFRYNVHQGDEVYLEVTDPDGLGNETQSPTLAHRYLYGPAVDQVLAVEDVAGNVLWGLGDHQGTVRDVVDPSGNLAEHRQYDSFGNLTDPAAPAVDFLFAFTGRPLDPDTGLYDYRARWYDPGIGRFVTEDPLGLDAGDANLYRYAGNSPVINVDPSGLGYTGFGTGMSSGTAATRIRQIYPDWQPPPPVQGKVSTGALLAYAGALRSVFPAPAPLPVPPSVAAPAVVAPAVASSRSAGTYDWGYVFADRLFSSGSGDIQRWSFRVLARICG